MSLVSTLSNGIKVATLNNGVKAVQVGLFSAKGSGMESMESVGQMNLLANCVNLNANPMVNASVSRNATVVRSVGKNGLNRISAALRFGRLRAMVCRFGPDFRGQTEFFEFRISSAPNLFPQTTPSTKPPLTRPKKFPTLKPSTSTTTGKL